MRRVRLASRAAGAGAEGEPGSDFDPACAICFNDLTQADAIGQLPCGHAFHAQCIDTWLAQKRLCPFRCCPQEDFPPLAPHFVELSAEDAGEQPAQGEDGQ